MVIHQALMDDVHLLTARHFRYELRSGEKIFSSKFEAREVCIASQDYLLSGAIGVHREIA